MAHDPHTPHTAHDPHTARDPNTPPQPDDKYARESFSFRRMKGWQLWGITAFAAVVLVVVISYGIA